MDATVTSRRSYRVKYNSSAWRNCTGTTPSSEGYTTAVVGLGPADGPRVESVEAVPAGAGERL